MDSDLKSAKSAYQNAKAEGNHREEARWANVIGDILKNRGEYVKALKWIKIDYDVSRKHLPEKHLLTTCQSLGEIYLRLERFDEALTFQKKHLDLARDADDLVEEQRASTQLGRTYHELFSKSEHDHNSIRNAKKYFKSAMDLAVSLKENPPPNSKSSFLKEYIDSYNNIGMLEMEIENLHEAQKILIRGLEICDEEEISEYDDGRSRLHHNLGNVYMELRMWNEARKNIKKDILICHKIGHCQGEAKGYINLGEMHYRTQKYDEARSFYKKALALAKSLEDEDALVRQINQNIEIVKSAGEVMDEIKREEQKLKKLKRDIVSARGTLNERKCLLMQNGSLEILVEKARTISAWEKLREFAKEKKKVAKDLCDRQRLGDSYLDVAESYQKLRKFNKAIKWYKKSWQMYKTIGNLEGQAMVKINIGNVLDSTHNWREAYDAFEESYSIARDAGLPGVQLLALENMHYSNMIRFDNEDETRRLKLLIDKLKKSSEKHEADSTPGDCCSETDTEADVCMSNSESDDFCFPKTTYRSETPTPEEELNDDNAPLMSLYQSIKGSSSKITGHKESHTNSTKQVEQSPRSLTKLTSENQAVVGRKRVRMILSDDDDDDEMECSSRKDHDCLLENLPNYEASKSKISPSKIQVVPEYGSKCAINVEESSSSFKCWSPNTATKTSRRSRSLSNDIVVEPDFPSGSKCDTDVSGKQNVVAHPMTQHSQDDQYITCRIDNDIVYVEAALCSAGDQVDIDSLKAVIACLYYQQFPAEKKSEGLLPIIQHIKCAGRDLESLATVENLKEHLQNNLVEAFIDGWIQKRLIKTYVDCCKELSEVPKMKVLKKLYNLEVSDDEIIVSDCDLQDLSITPLIDALHSQMAFSMLDISHNCLGNGTMEKLRKVFTASGQSYGGLTLDLHCNRFGPTTLFQICECSVLFARLEVLNISGNRLTDACGSYLSTILKNCTALCSLNVENCSITTRTIQKVADALDSRSVLSHLCIGHNSPVSGNALVNLLLKLSTLKRFSELNMSGIKLGKPVVDGLCQLAGTLNLSGLILGGTGIGNEGAIKVTEPLLKGTEELVKLDLSYCGLTSDYNLSINVNSFCSITDLSLEGNPIMFEGSNTLFSLLINPQCCLKVLILRKCQLGFAGVLHIIEALADNSSLEELNLADNSVPTELSALQCDLPSKSCSQNQEDKLDTMKVDDNQEADCSLNNLDEQLVVADSEDIPVGAEAAASGIDDSCASSCQRNSSPECHLTPQFSTAIAKAKNLQLLDLSNNSFSSQTAETFYGSWTTLRPLSSHRHITKNIIHFSTKERKCCSVKPCCKKV